MDKATEVVQRMIARGLQPNEVTYSSLANGWVKKGAMDRYAHSLVLVLVGVGLLAGG
jgi:hypothetical protein